MVKKCIINKENKFIHKNVSITEKQEKWIKDKCINLSRFLQKRLDEEVKNETNTNRKKE